MNISITDYIFAHFNYARDMINLVRRYIHAYRNSPMILFNILRRKYPFEAHMTHGESVVISSYREAKYTELLSRMQTNSNYQIELDFSNGLTTVIPKFHSNGLSNNFKLYDSIDNGDIFAIFINGEYDSLDVAGKTVIDVGANIGDSSIYFIYRGARKVIALEPYPKTYSIALKNILTNNLNHDITLIMAGCAAISATITVDPNYQSSPASKLAEFKHGTKVPLMTLDEIMDQNNAKEQAILKLDCEGNEYDIILSASKKTLKRFQQIQIEYHYGYKNLKKKLEECGFKVEVTRPEMPSLLLRYFRLLSGAMRREGHKGTDNITQPKDVNTENSIYKQGYIGYLYATDLLAP